VALAIDWGLSLLATSALIGRAVWDQPGSMQWAPLGVFALEASILTALLGGAAGQLVLRLTVRRTNGQPLDLLRAVVRSLLICAVIPPLVFNRDNQGLHDLAVDSIVLRR
jgi:uncharacterized RDD family membrane protein YckC